MKRYLILAICVFLCGLGSAPATGAEYQNYVVGKMGVYSPQSNDLESYDNGFNGEIALGHYFNRNLAGEVGLGYFGTGGTFYGYNGYDGYFSDDVSIDVVPMTASLKAILPLNSQVELYGIGGIGLYFVNANIDTSSQYRGHYSTSDDDATLGAHLGGGITINMDKRLFLGAEAKYLWANANFNGNLQGDVDLDGFIFTANIGYRF